MDSQQKKKKAESQSGNVSVADTPTPSPSVSPAVSEKPAEGSAVTPEPQVPEKPFVLIEVPQLTPEQIAAAKSFNFPLDKLFEGLSRINAYATFTEERFAKIEKGFQQVGVVLEKIAPLANLAQQMQNQPQSGGQRVDPTAQMLIQMLMGGGGGGGGADPRLKTLADEIFMSGVENMMYGNAMNKAIYSKIGSALGEEIASDVGARMQKLRDSLSGKVAEAK